MKVKLFREREREREREACLAGGKLNKFLIVGLKSDVREIFGFVFMLGLEGFVGSTIFGYFHKQKITHFVLF